MWWMITLLVLETLAIIGMALMLKYYEPVKKFLATIQQKPHFRVIIRNTADTEEGMAKIDSEFNTQFLWVLDRAYSKLGSSDYDANMPDHAKIAIFIDDITSDVAEQYRPDLPPDMGEDIDANVPPMFLNGGPDGRQVVDLAKTIHDKTGATVEVG